MKKLKFSSILLLVLSLLALRQIASAQTLSTINVDSLSDAQVDHILREAEASGKSNAELMQFAKDKGVTDSQLKRFQLRLANGKNNLADSIRPVPRRVNSPAATVSSAASAVQAKPYAGSRIFGADLFNGATTTFEPNLRLATPHNYILGPDDQLLINVFGRSVVNWKLIVSPEGNINIPGVGVISVYGKTVEQATSVIKSQLAAHNYAIGKGTSVQVSLGDIRSIKVVLNGEVSKPGTYTLPSLATAFNALYSSGGPNPNGSLRKIEIIRNNKIIRRLDVYDFLLKGDQKDNITLQDQDIIRVPTYRVRVDIGGEIKRPAIYEVLTGETLQDVINFAGGFSDLAYTSKIKVLQIADQQRTINDVYEADYKNYIPLRGDQYIVDKILESFKNRVNIGGAVIRPGDYELDKGLTLSKLIAKASGLRKDVFANRGSVTRLRADNTVEIISFNVQDVINNPSADIALQSDDVVSISSIFDLRDNYNVVIKGEVRHPGTFPYAEKMTVEDLILKAGGLTEGGSAKRLEVSRRITNSESTVQNGPIAEVFAVDINDQLLLNSNFSLKPYDIVSVYTKPGFEIQKSVKVEGEVMYPGYYTIKTKGERISDLVTRAGGLTGAAFPDGGTLKRVNSATLGFDKNKIDTAALQRERDNRNQILSKTLNDAEIVSSERIQNNYVGIDLEKIIAHPGSRTDMLLEDGDVLRVPKKQQVVRVNGEVLFPSSIVYDSGESFKGYVINAGGFSEFASKRKSYVVYPNGTVKGTRKFLFFNVYPSVKPGSDIYIPKKRPRQGITTQEVIGFTSGLATLGLVILGVINLTK